MAFLTSSSEWMVLSALWLGTDRTQHGSYLGHFEVSRKLNQMPWECAVIITRSTFAPRISHLPYASRKDSSCYIRVPPCLWFLSWTSRLMTNWIMAKRSPPSKSLAFSEQILLSSGEPFPTALFAVLATFLTFFGSQMGRNKLKEMF